jgi:hypothetical protein
MNPMTPSTAERLREALKTLLFIHDNVDETGYVTDVGFYPVDEEIEKARALATQPAEQAPAHYDDLERAEESLRQICIICGGFDPSDGEGTTPEEIVTIVERFAKERKPAEQPGRCVWRVDEHNRECLIPGCSTDVDDEGWNEVFLQSMKFCPHCGNRIEKHETEGGGKL